MAFGITQNNGSNITGFSAAVQPDKGLSRTSTPKVHTITFGDGYHQRIADGINNLEQDLTVSFSTRPKSEIDDLIAFFESLGGVSKFKFILEDSNEGSNEEAIKCICSSWSQTWAYANFYSLSCTFNRVYEA